MLKIRYLIKRAGFSLLIFFSAYKVDAQIPNNVPTLKDRALQALEEGNISLAYTQLSSWIQSHPFDSEGYKYRAQLYEKTNQFIEAEADYNSLLELDPSNREGLLARGRILYRLKKYENARLDFKACLIALPGETTQVFYRQSATGNGTSQIFTAQTKNPAFIFYHLGLCNIAIGDFPEAIAMLDSAIYHNPKEADFWSEKGKANASYGDKETALKNYQMALKLNPDHFLARQRISFLQNQEDMSQLEELNLIVLEYPDKSESYLQRGYFFYQLKRYVEAIKDFDQVLAMDREDSQALIYRGKAHSSLQNWDAAENDFSQAIELNEKDVEAYLARGQNRYRAANLESAMADFIWVLSYDPEDPIGYYHRGITLHRLGKIREACPDLLRAKELGMEEAETVWNKICNQKN